MQSSRVLVGLVLLPLLAVGLVWGLGQRTAQRAAAGALFFTAAVAAYLLVFGLSGGLGRRAMDAGELVQPLWRVLSVHRLQLAVGLSLDRPAAVLLGVLALLGGWAVLASERRAAAWLCAAYAATAVALLGDGLLTRLVGWELLTAAGWGLSRRRADPVLGLARAGDATLLLATALLFWSLGGSWSSSRLDARYQLDFSPPTTLAEAGEPETEPGPTLELAGLRRQLHGPAGREAEGTAVRAALGNKLWLGGRLLTWLGALFALAVALKAAAGALQIAIDRRSALAARLWLGTAALLAGCQLLWRLR